MLARSGPDSSGSGMSEPGLRLCGSAIQPDKKPGLLGSSPAAIVVLDMRWVRSGPTWPSARRAAHGMAGAAAPDEALLSEPRLVRARLSRGAQLRLSPSLEGLGRIGENGENHMRVLLAAILRALAAIDAGPVGLEPGDVCLAGDELNLSAEARDPERVDDVFALEGEAHRLSDWNVNLVRRHECLRGIVVEIGEFPPPLMAAHLDRQSRLTWRIGDSRPSSGSPDDQADKHDRRDADADRDPTLCVAFQRAEFRRRRRRGRAAKWQSGPEPQ